jgi:hypothetical protein
VLFEINPLVITVSVIKKQEQVSAEAMIYIPTAEILDIW